MWQTEHGQYSSREVLEVGPAIQAVVKRDPAQRDTWLAFLNGRQLRRKFTSEEGVSGGDLAKRACERAVAKMVDETKQAIAAYEAAVAAQAEPAAPGPRA